MPAKPEKETFQEAINFCRKKGYLRKARTAISRVSTEIVGIDYLLGGGIPKGRITEISGKENSGKTTLAAEIAKAFQKQEYLVLYLDFEHAVDIPYFKTLGLNTEDEGKFLYLQPQCLEEGMDAAIKLIKTGEVGLLLVDSVAAMTPREEIEGGMESQQIGLQARGIGKALRILVGILETTSTAAIFINQLRDKIGGFIPGLTSTTGGRALGYYSSIRFELKKMKQEKFGTVHRAVLKKQKTCYFQPTVIDFVINKSGVDRQEALITSLINVGLIKNHQGKYFYKKNVLADSRESLKAILSKENVGAKFIQALYAIWGKTESIISD